MPDLDTSSWGQVLDAIRGQGPLAGQLLVILGVAWLAIRFGSTSIHHLIRPIVDRSTVTAASPELTTLESRKRIETIDTLAIRVFRLLVTLVAGAMVLEALGISVAPALAGLGIIGVAVGFGAQHLVKDYVNGALIVLENQFSRGDVVKIAGVAGLVEDISLRRTTLRDLDGIVHIVPNGEISVTSNLTRGWGRVNEDVLVGYGTNVDQVAAIIAEVGTAMAQDPDWSAKILEAPRLERIEALADSGIRLKILATVGPADRWAVAGELRRRLLAAFARAGVEIPFPHRVVVARPGAADDSAATGEQGNGQGDDQPDEA